MDLFINILLMIIKLKLESSDKLGPIVLNLCENINQLLTVKKGEINKIDLSEINWIYPLNILPIATLLSDLQNKGYKLNIIPPVSLKVKSYLKTINFFKGIHTLDTLRNKNYIPIIFMSAKPDQVKNREQIETCLKNILLKQMSGKRTLSNALGYTLSEMFDNIWEHSKSEYGWFLAQYYKNKNYVEICILDNGISLKGSYDRKKINVKNDTKAIELALSGVSTKKEERGMGLLSTKKLVTESSLRGKFLLLSGKSGYYKYRNKELLFNLKCHWRGTIVLFRLYKTKDKVEWAPYVDYRSKL